MLFRGVTRVSAIGRTAARGAAAIGTNSKETSLRRYFAERSYGNLKDSDRIFTNLYLDGSPYIDGAIKRVC